jgi:hypothetical protein
LAGVIAPTSPVPQLVATPRIALRRTLLVVAAGLAATALLAGLGRLGFGLPARSQGGAHGTLLVLGVFLTVISLERAVAAGLAWTYAAPVLSALGGVASLFEQGTTPRVGAASIAAIAAVGAASVLMAVNITLVRQQAVAFTAMMLLGSLVLLASVGGWAVGLPLHAVTPAWLAFFVLTILAERLELSRLAPTPSRATRLLALLATTYAALVLALAVMPLAGGPAGRAMGLLLIAIALWQARYDLARRTVLRAGLPRFAAVGVLLGTAWLCVAGAIVGWHGWVIGGPVYDATLHAIFVGFVLSMVFAHAPIILPAVARIELPFRPVFYLPLALLHLGLIARVAGDLGGSFPTRRVGALVSALALPTFFLAVLASRRLARAVATPG